MRTSFSHSAKESLSTGHRAQGTYSVPRKSVPSMLSNQDNIIGVKSNITVDIRERLDKTEANLSTIAAQVLELYNQNKSFLQVLLTNNSQLEAIATSVRDTELLVSTLRNIICETTPTQSRSRRWNTVRSASLPVSSKLYGTLDSLNYGSTPSPQRDPIGAGSVRGLTPNVGDCTPRVASISPVNASRSLQPLAATLSVQRPGSPEQQEVAALLAASAAAQVMAEQHGLEDVDTVFYNKVLTKLLSPQPNVTGGNWDTNMSRRVTTTADIAVGGNNRAPKYKQSVEISPRPMIVANIDHVSPARQDLNIITYPTNNLNNYQDTCPIVLEELPPPSHAIEVESPVGPGATLTFKGGHDSFSQKIRSKKVSLDEKDNCIKIPTQSSAALQLHCDPISSTAAHDSKLSLEPNKLDPIVAIADKPEPHSSNPETTKLCTVDLVSADLSLGPQTPDTISQPQSPHVFTDELQTLIAVAEPHAVVLQSDQGLVSLSTERSKTQDTERITTIVRQSSTKKRSGSKCTPRPRSASKPKQKSKSQPTSRSSSRRNSINKQGSMTIASPSPRLSKQSPTKTQTKIQVKPIPISTRPDSRHSIMSQTSIFNVSSDAHLGSAGPSSMTSMSLSTAGARPGTKNFPRSSSLPLSSATNRLKTDKTRLNMILEKYSEASGLLPISEEQKHNQNIDPLEYKKVFTNVILFMRFFLDYSNCDPFSPLPTDDLLTRYASVLCEKMQHVPLDTVGKHLILTAEWIVEQFTSEHFFDYIVTQSFVAEYFTHFPKSLPEVSLEISTDNRRRKEEYDRLMIEYEIERKKLSPRSKRQDKLEEPRKYTMEQFHTAFKRCLRNLWGPELERELIYYFNEKYMDMTATEGIILQEVTELVENPKKSIFPDHNLYNYADLFNKYQESTLSSVPENRLPNDEAHQCVAYNLYFYYCLLSIYLLLNDCLPIRFNIYFMNYKTFQGVFRYINPEDLEKPMNMSSNFRLYWPAWKDVRRGTLRLYCKFVEVKRDERSSRLH